MTKKMSLLVCAAVFAMFCQAAETPAQKEVFVTGKVNADWLNVRTGAALSDPVAGKIPQDTTVKIYREMGNWLVIAVPETLKLYVSEARVNPDGTLNGELNVRTAMSTESVSLGVLAKGSKVERLDERANGWVRIKAPAHLRLCVAGFLVNYDKNAFAANGYPLNSAEAKPVPAVDKPAAEKAVPAVDKPAAEKTPAAPAANAEAVTLKGVLVKWKYSEVPETAFALLDAPKGRNQGFVLFAADKLAALDGKSVTVSGKITGRTKAGAVIITADSVTAESAE